MWLTLLSALSLSPFHPSLINCENVFYYQFTDEKNVQARLVKTDNTYGVVELKDVGGNWSRVCPDSISEPAWDNRDAVVICRMLGYKGSLGGTLVMKPPNSGKDFMLKKYHCRGDEKNIGECAYSSKYAFPCPASGYYAGAFCLNNDSKY